jgi:hypothetical protein
MQDSSAGEVSSGEVYDQQREDAAIDAVIDAATAAADEEELERSYDADDSSEE